MTASSDDWSDSSPAYRVQAVARLTGVSAARLRVWEKRYGTPSPIRSEGGYRLYSARDVGLVKRIVELIGQGMSVGEAVGLASAPEGVDAHRGAPPALPTDPDIWAGTRARLIDSARRFDRAGLERELQRVVGTVQAAEAYRIVLRPVLAEAGAAWSRGELSVAAEHLLSEEIGSAMRVLLRVVRPTRPHATLLLACIAEEAHDLPLYGLGLEAADLGCSVVVLGARTPPTGIAAAVSARRFDGVVLSATIADPDAEPGALMEAYGGACGSLAWACGGPAASAWSAEVESAGGRVLHTPADFRDFVRRC